MFLRKAWSRGLWRCWADRLLPARGAGRGPEEPLRLVHEPLDPCTPGWVSLVVGVPLRRYEDPRWQHWVAAFVDELAEGDPLGVILAEIDPRGNWYEDELPRAGARVAVGPEPGRPGLVRVAAHVPAGPARRGLLRDLWDDQAADLGLLHFVLLGGGEREGGEDSAGFLKEALGAELKPPLGQGLLYACNDGAALEVHVPTGKQPLALLQTLVERSGLPCASLTGEWPLG